MNTRSYRNLALLLIVVCFVFFWAQAFHEDWWRHAEASPSVDKDSAAILNSQRAYLKQQKQALLRNSDSLQAQLPSRFQQAGRRINIVVCGVDTRIGEGTPHADANHVISLLVDSGRIEIISVPRDTPADAGYAVDSTKALINPLNIIANVRARRGMHSYQRELQRITGLNEIPYYVEVGFSQALGIIEFLGYKEPQQTLRVLRSRKAHTGGDFQRVYNQGQFIAQSIKNHIHRFDGVFGDVLLRTGLLFVNTNLSASEAKGIIENLRSHGFLQSPEKNISVRLEPRVRIRFQAIDFSNSAEVDSLHAKIDRLARVLIKQDSTSVHIDSVYAKKLLWSHLIASVADSTHPRDVIRRLQRPFEQRAWMQVADTAERTEIRRWVGQLLTGAYTKIGKPEKATGIQKIIQRETEFFLLQQQ